MVSAPRLKNPLKPLSCVYVVSCVYPCRWAVLVGPNFESQEEAEIFLSSRTSKLALGSTQPPIQWVPGYFTGEG